jgi:hypothetical protein
MELYDNTNMGNEGIECKSKNLCWTVASKVYSVLGAYSELSAVNSLTYVYLNKSRNREMTVAANSW